MKTLIIYITHFDGTQYAIVEGDYSDYNGANLDSSYNIEFNKEIRNFLSDQTGELRFNFSDDVSLMENKQWDKVAIITFLP